MITVAQRAWVAILLAVLVVSGLAGAELWPITGWKLFSLSRDASQTEWAIDVVGRDGSRRELDLEELPLAFRNAAWPMAALPGASVARRQDMCVALRAGADTVVPDNAGVALVRELRTMRIVDGDPVISEEREVLHECLVTE